MRQKYIDHYKSSVRGIIYVVDSSNIQKQLRDAAEFLFNIISEPAVFAARPRLLVACNKQDVGLAKGAAVVRRELQRELNLLRATHSRSLQGTNDTPVADHVFLGHEGQDFEFQDLPMKVTLLKSLQRGGTRSDARFCHQFSCEFYWPVDHTTVAVQPSNKQPCLGNF